MTTNSGFNTLLRAFIIQLNKRKLTAFNINFMFTLKFL